MGRYRGNRVVEKLDWTKAFWVFVGGAALGAYLIFKRTKNKQQQLQARADDAMQARQQAEQRAAEAEQQEQMARLRAESARRNEQSLQLGLKKVEAQLADANKEIAELKKQPSTATAQGEQPTASA